MGSATETDNSSRPNMMERAATQKPPSNRSSSIHRLDKIFNRSNTSTVPFSNGNGNGNGVANGDNNGKSATLEPSPKLSPSSSTTHSPILGADLTKQASPLEPLPAAALTPTPTPHKSMSSQLQRMFSRTGRSKEGSIQDHHAESVTSAHGERPLVDRKQSVMSTKKPSFAEEVQMKRFELLPDGSHSHHLKSAKRQEKLTGMFRELILGKKKDDFGEADGLGLVSSWVDQLKADKDKVATDKSGGPKETATLVEKYGKCQEVVGRGAFGIVRISHKIDPKNEGKEQLYAVKEFRRRPQESAKKYTKRLTSEFCISSSLRHPNVIHTLDLLQDAKGDYCEVMEFCAGGDLYTLILAAGKLDVAEADCYFKQLMRGVEYMHEMGVAHRDLKPENLLLTSRGALKITDFGNGECFRMAWEKEAHKTGGLCGSAPYISPEEYTEKEFDPRAVDVWATGVIYMAMRTGRHLWRVAKRDEDEFFEKYLEGRKDEGGYGPIESLHRVGARCRNVIYSILDPNPTRRINASQVLKSEWGREIRVCEAGEEGF